METSPAKTETCAFNLYNKQANKNQKSNLKVINKCEVEIPLDHILSYKKLLYTT